MKHKTLILAISLAAFIALSMGSCSSNDTSFSDTGLQFLDKAFSSYQIGAKDMLSDDVEIGWGGWGKSSYEKKEIFLEWIKELREELPGIKYCPKFEYHTGFSCKVWDMNRGSGYYTYDGEKDHIIVVSFEEKKDKWCVNNLAILEPEDLISEYRGAKEDLEKDIQGKRKEEIKLDKASIKYLEKVIYAFEDFFTESQFQEFNEIRSGK